MIDSPFSIVCLVPSWTETLVSAGVNVSARTRYCTEPSDHIGTIPVVGGTKDWDLPLIQSLHSSLLILDKEENPKFMSEGHLIPFVATHVNSISSCAHGIRQISEALAGKIDSGALIKLDNLAKRWLSLPSHGPLFFEKPMAVWDNLPGVIEWIKKPDSVPKSIYYVIWKNPWMVAAQPTFIGSICNALGLPISPASRNTNDSLYPELDLTQLDPLSTLLLFSSEPYPFHKKTAELKALDFPSAIVDGQSFSWFGIRSLRFLEAAIDTVEKNKRDS